MRANFEALSKLLASRRFFGFIVVLFLVEAVWLALSSRFPMPYDESYHFALIRFFAHHLNPFVSSQPPDTYWLGAIPHNPSFLYHYLLAFPEILFRHLSGGLKTQIIALRLINVSLAVINLIILRKLFRRLGASPILNNFLVLIYAFTPVVTTVSAQISYDNLLFPLINLAVLQATFVAQEFKKKTINMSRLILLICLCLLGCLVKFVFLPIFAAILISLFYLAIKDWKNRSDFIKQTGVSLRRLSGASKLFLGLGLLISLSLFISFYAVNIMKFHLLAPNCPQVLSAAQCQHNYTYEKFHQAATANLGVGPYAVWWLIINFLCIFGAVTPLVGLSYFSPVYIFLILVIGFTGLICLAVNFKKIFSIRGMVIAGAAGLVYLMSLFLDNLFAYRSSGVESFIGRYLIIILPLVYLSLALGLKLSLETARIKSVKFIIAGLTGLAFIILGGALPYVSHVAPDYGHIDQSDFSSEQQIYK